MLLIAENLTFKLSSMTKLYGIAALLLFIVTSTVLGQPTVWKPLITEP
jgi:hypothetical protein